MAASRKYLPWLTLPLLGLVLVFSGSSRIAAAGTTVKTLPGFSGELPFTLETGYVSVNDAELFYYFVESENDPIGEPLLIYLVGGPSCSSLNALFLQTASIIFIDIPVGAGFSYTTTQAGYAASDLKSVAQIISFLRKWLLEHPKFLKNQFFIASDSYSGAIAPVITQQIINENEAGVELFINLVGFISGCAHTDSTIEDNAVVPYAYRMALISKPLFEATRDSCEGYYIDTSNSSAACQIYIDAIDQCTEEISTDNILEAKCANNSPKPEGRNRRSLGGRNKYSTKKSILSHITKPAYWCRNVVYELLVNWANDKSVQKALNVREGTVKRWVRCNLTLILEDLYTYDVTSGIPYQENLTRSGLQLLFYSGDHDMVVPHIATESWISALNITTDSAWRPWFFNGQIAGYTVKYYNVGYRLTYATLKMRMSRIRTLSSRMEETGML